MVVIRLSRGGSKKRPFYHVTVADRREARDGSFIDRLGFFNPIARGQEERLRIDIEKVEGWVAKGAEVIEHGPADFKGRVGLAESRGSVRRGDGRDDDGSPPPVTFHLALVAALQVDEIDDGTLTAVDAAVRSGMAVK